MEKFRSNKGRGFRWASFMFIMVIIMAGMKFLFAFAHDDVGVHIATALMLLLGGIIILIIPAYIIGLLVDKFKKNNNVESNLQFSSKGNDIAMNKQENTQINKAPSSEIQTKPVVEPIIVNFNDSDNLPGQDKMSANFIPKSEPQKQFDTIKTSEDFYAQAWDEINDKSKTPEKGLWSKSFAIAQGDEKKAQAKYIELRVAQLQEIYNRNQHELIIQEEQRAKLEAEVEAKRSAEERASKIAKQKLEAQRKGFVEVLWESGDAFCIVCRKVSPIKGMFHHNPTDTYYHRACLPNWVK